MDDKKISRISSFFESLELDLYQNGYDTNSI